jgi:phosphopantothenoylcysteine decarboxylase/phosphopantothenate--cysteine ligase
MAGLTGKKILVGVSGSIAAYKSAMLVRLLIKNGAEVQVIMTDAARDFITPLTLATLSKRPVLTTFSNERDGSWTNHVELGLWADALIIAPATARTLSRCATGSCDNLLSAVYLSARCPVFFAPAMDVDMYRHRSTTINLERLLEYGNIIIASEYGELASGLTGEGRMAEPENILNRLIHFFSQVPVALGKKVLITAGPTVEPIDPVRFISNRSSGKMGYAIANAFNRTGASVSLVSGPTNLSVDDGVKMIAVASAAEMLIATRELFDASDLVIYAAAVADYTPALVAKQKIKKHGDNLDLQLVKTADIAATTSDAKKPGQITIGFALETENELEFALDKLHRKNFDYIVLNSLNDPGAGFAYDTNKITVIDKSGNKTVFPLKSKEEVAQDILNIVLTKWSEV